MGKSSIVCTACPSHTTAPKSFEGIEVCRAVPGYIGHDGKGARPCPPNTYKPQIGYFPCVECPKNSVGIVTAAKKKSDCKAAPGFTG